MRIIGNNPAAENAEITAVASGTMADGKAVVVNADGTVSVVSGASGTEGIGSNVVYQNAAVDYPSSAYDSNSNRTVVAYRTSGAQYAAVGTVTASNNSISWGTPVSPGGGSSSFNAATFDSSNNKIVLANTAKVRVATVDPSDNSISFGTAVDMSYAAQYVAATFDSNSNRVVIAFRPDGSPTGGWAVVGSVSGTNITLGTAVRFETGTTSNIAIAFDSNSNRVVIAYRDDSNANKPTAIVGSVDPSDNSISFGTSGTYNTGNSYNIGCGFDSSSNKIVITYRNSASGGSSYGTAVVGTVDPSDNSISFGTPVIFAEVTLNGSGVTYDVAAGKIVIAYANGSNSTGGVISGTVSGTTISFDTAVQYESGVVKYPGVAYDSTSSRVVISYEDDGSGTGIGTSAVFSTGYNSTNLTSENFIGFANGAASDTGTARVQIGSSINGAQSSLTAGQQYFVQTDGTLGLTADDPSVIAGTAVSATDIIVKG